MGETVVYVARIRTMDPARPLAEAVAVRDGKVVAVGSRAEVERSVSSARVVERPGAVVVPGLIDAHAHLVGLGMGLSTLRFSEARSLDEVLAIAAKAPKESFQGDWLIGRGWDQNDWPDKRFPDRQKLDALFPTTPVFFSRVDGHAVWVNGEALRRAGITRETKDPPGGRILRDERGDPTGVLVDNAIDLVREKLPEPSDAQLQGWLKRALERCAEVGLTSVHDAGMELRAFEVLQQWDALGALPIRVYAMADGQGKDAQAYLGRGTFRGRHLTMRAVKFYLDGALGSRGAALHQPYSDEPGQKGLLLTSPEELERKARSFAERGFQVAVHAIGDRANTLGLDLLGRLERERPGSRHRLEHAQVVRPEDLPRFAKEKVIASLQPTHATSDMPWAEARLGKERLKGAYAWRTLLESGAKLAFGSDFPVEEPDPLLGLYAARTRQDASGKPEGGWTPEERLSGEQALEAFTAGAAYAAFAEDRLGVLKPGMEADFVALTVDPVEAPPRELLGGKVLLTVMGGREVYRR